MSCGCTDTEACPGGCSWLRVDRGDGTGVCSNCGVHLARWEAGDRSAWYGEGGEPEEDPGLMLPGDAEEDIRARTAAEAGEMEAT